ncbi:MAG: N-acetylglucosamine-6-phosphate deacetylase [Alistipes sp.]|nr:N-acetylglucosamine-6-phosphate deacetylase [Alistipes sp.]MBQ5618996.1 N-acetylglucosamine-6-phosphate deacetylase [Alistipes sp.]MBQ5923675.1 N-acetylglucosamine-6-phosphate deacetylase [Alistipes sp.]
MLKYITNAQILTPHGWVENGTISFCDGRITSIKEGGIALSDKNVTDAQGAYIIPGAIDLHVHGGGGHDFMECNEEAFRIAAKTHLRHGTTAIYPTLGAASHEGMMQAIEITERLMAEPSSTIMGLHFEGPYLNPKMAGGQIPEYICNPAAEQYTEMLNRTNCIKRWDAAPELEGSMEFAQYAASKGVMVAIAHTTADYNTLQEAYNAGFTHVTHFYNAMTSVHKRREFKYEGTIEGVYLIDEMSVELIADGIHVPPAIMRLVHKIKGAERICLVTDAMACTGGDTDKVFDERVIIEDGVCKLADRSALAGSIATMDRLIRTMVQKAEIPLAEAVRMTSETPARIMGIYDRKGSLAVGKDADIVMMDDSLTIRGVWSMGQQVEL